MRDKGMPNGAQYKAGYEACSEDFRNFGIRYVQAFAAHAKDFPLDWFLTGYKTRLQLATEAQGR